MLKDGKAHASLAYNRDPNLLILLNRKAIPAEIEDHVSLVSVLPSPQKPSAKSHGRRKRQES